MGVALQGSTGVGKQAQIEAQLQTAAYSPSPCSPRLPPAATCSAARRAAASAACCPAPAPPLPAVAGGPAGHRAGSGRCSAPALAEAGPPGHPMGAAKTNLQSPHPHPRTHSKSCFAYASRTSMIRTRARRARGAGRQAIMRCRSGPALPPLHTHHHHISPQHLVLRHERRQPRVSVLHRLLVHVAAQHRHALRIVRAQVTLGCVVGEQWAGWRGGTGRAGPAAARHNSRRTAEHSPRPMPCIWLSTTLHATKVKKVCSDVAALRSGDCPPKLQRGEARVESTCRLGGRRHAQRHAMPGDAGAPRDHLSLGTYIP